MRSSTRPARILRNRLGAVGVVAIVLSGVAQVTRHLPRTASRGEAAASAPARNPPACGSSSPPPANPSGHSVKLSWNASVPKSSAKTDSIQGYYIYRSLTSNKYNDSNRINLQPLVGTSCVDTTVSPQVKYFYVVKAVAGSGLMSAASNEATAAIPPP
jgi:hypothetical protein